MLATLTDLKARLSLDSADDDDLLTRYLQAVSGLFDNYCHRTFARTEAAEDISQANVVNLTLRCYPVEIVIAFYTRSKSRGASWRTARADWQVDGPAGVLTIQNGPLGTSDQQLRILYTGGYVLPGTTPLDGETALPKDIEHAALEQAAHWYVTRHDLRLANMSGEGSAQRQLRDQPILPLVTAILDPYRRMLL